MHISVYTGEELSSLTLIDPYAGVSGSEYHPDNVMTLTMEANQSYNIAIFAYDPSFSGYMKFTSDFTADGE